MEILTQFSTPILVVYVMSQRKNIVPDRCGTGQIPHDEALPLAGALTAAGSRWGVDTEDVANAQVVFILKNR